MKELLMKENSFLTNVYNNICRDTGKQNESARLIAAVRFLTLSLIVHAFVSCILVSFTSHISGMVISVVSLILFLAVFTFSYNCSTFLSYCALNVIILLWTILNVYYFGWNVGIQHFLMVLLVFAFFCKYKHEKEKIIYVVFLFIVRLFLYYYCKSHDPVVALDSFAGNAMQTANTFFTFWCLSLIAYLFSSNTQELEGKLIEYNKTLMKQANTDTLTGLYNRRRTMAYLEKLLAESDTQISICLCDIDFFKRVNDTYGHDVGDEVLKTVADTFQKKLPPGTFISRWGGEEFLLIFPGMNGDEAGTALEIFRQKLRTIVFDGGTETFSITLTFGLVEYDFRSDITTLLKEADEKLYLGKESGRDRIIF